MKFLCFATGLISGPTLGLLAQMERPTHWTGSLHRKDSTKAVVRLKATIDAGWHLYAMNADEVFLPLQFKFPKSPFYKKVGKARQPKPHHEEYDDIMQGVARWFEKEAIFEQDLELLTQDDFELKVTVEGQACTDLGKCVQVEEEIIIPVKGTTGRKALFKPDSLPHDSVQTALPAATLAPKKTLLDDSSEVPMPEPLSDGVIKKLDDACGSSSVANADRSFWGIFLAGFLGGFLALLTPCVFPMIPLTVSFFTKQSHDRSKGLRNAILYALSILLIYTGLGFIITRLFGAEALNQMASSAFFNLLFFVVFVIFAISFFGAFEITIPSGFVSRVDKASTRGGLLGIFFMAFTLSLVSFSCTGPIIGTLLVEAAQHGSTQGPLLGMFGFSLALALPFAVFAAFPGWLQSLPRSGAWLNTVKVTLGFLELALAMKFISNVDLAYHWGIIRREVFIALWIAIFGLMGIYLLGGLRFKGDSGEPLSIPRLLLGTLTLSFVIYLVPGLWGAPLRLISGFPPPDFYAEWKSEDNTQCPLNLDCEHDYTKAMLRARRLQKPVMLDFTGWNCVNCRKMEENVWPEKEVISLLRNEYILASLYCDDKAPLPPAQQYRSALTGKRITTVGGRWSDFQQQYFKANSQPLYVLISPEGRLLAAPRGYTPSPREYAAFLREGLCRFRQLKE
ncbi:MAG: protein-disulfide reductase DsbD family protein [Flavobacteriales bacterium]|nr:protein-disulfide reductase DsbD family protein [Flavobacteriales bacterium]